MTASDRPAPPAGVDPDLRAMLEALADEDAGTIRAVADHVDDLAAWAEDRSDSGRGPDAGPGRVRPEDVPETADVSLLDIDGAAYDYYQWREGDRIRSRTVRR